MKINFSIRKTNFDNNAEDWEVMTTKNGEKNYEYGTTLFKAIIKTIKWRKAYE